MTVPKIQVTGRNLKFSESARKRNPHLRGEIVEFKEPKNPKDNLNKTEKEFLARLRSGEFGNFTWIGIQAITMRLGFDCRYTPDFNTISEAGKMWHWEVKGAHCWDDAKVKIKSVASQYPFWTFVFAQKKDGVWTDKIMPR